MIEPWISGTLGDVHPALRTLLHSLEHVRLDLAEWTRGLTADQIWARPMGLGPVGFQLRHIAGATDRLFTYAEGRSLDESQMAALKSEMSPGASLDELMAGLDALFARVADGVRAIDPATLNDSRAVGRKLLPATVIGLLVHIAEHNLRHIGQLIVTVKVLRALESR